MAAKAQSVKTVARYFVKATGFVVYMVRSSKGKDTYCTTLDTRGKATGCTCPSYKPCYHMTGCERIEASRKQVKEPATTLSKRVGVVSHQEAIEVFRPLSDEIDEAYEVRGAAIVEAKRTRSCTCCGGNHATSTCWL